MALIVGRAIGANAEGAEVRLTSAGERGGRCRRIGRQRIGRVCRHHADAALLHDFVDDDEAFVTHLQIVLPGDFQMGHATAVGEKEEDIFRNAGFSAWLALH